MPKLFIYTDVQVTRRQAIHHVMDEHSVLRFSAARIDACLKWCFDMGHQDVVLAGPADLIRITISDVIPADQVDESTVLEGRLLLEYFAKRAS